MCTSGARLVLYDSDVYNDRDSMERSKYVLIVHIFMCRGSTHYRDSEDAENAKCASMGHNSHCKGTMSHVDY